MKNDIRHESDKQSNKVICDGKLVHGVLEAV